MSGYGVVLGGGGGMLAQVNFNFVCGIDSSVSDIYTANGVTDAIGYVASIYNPALVDITLSASSFTNEGSYQSVATPTTLVVPAGASVVLMTAQADTNYVILSTSVAPNLGTIAVQDADAVAITGGTIDGTVIGGTVPANATIDALTLTSGTITDGPVNGPDIANKAYVDSVAVGLQPKAASQVVAVNNITLSGLQTIDTYTTIAGDRVLVAGQTDPTENGIYIADAGAWTRSTDADTWAELLSATTFILEGVVYAGTTWNCDIPATGTIGVDPITWLQFSAAQVYSAGAGLTLSGGTTFNLTPTGVTPGVYGSATETPTLTVNAFGEISAITMNDISAVGLAGGAAGQVLYQTATDATGFTATGTAGQSLLSAGAGTPTWGTPPTANNLAGGSVFSLPYQTTPNNTVFLAPSTDGYVLTTHALGAAPTWTNASTLLSAPPPIGNVTPNTVASSGVTVTQGGNTGSPIIINSANTRGGAGYSELIQFTNTNGGVSNPNKYLRLDNTGSLELINSAYSSTIFSVSNSGIVGTGSAIFQGATQTNANPNTGNNNGIKGPAGYIAYEDNLQNIVLGDYTQGSHDTWVETGRSIFLAANAVNADATNPVYTMTLNNDGQMLFGSSSTTPLGGYAPPKMSIYSNNSSWDGATIIGYNTNNTLNLGKVAPNSNGSGVGGSFIAFVGNGSATTASYGTVQVNGSGVTYNTSSDARLKTDREAIVNGLECVKALDAVNFKWIEDGSAGQGFIAQEAQNVVPLAVTEGEFLTMDYSRMVPVLWAAVKELAAQVEALQNK